MKKITAPGIFSIRQTLVSLSLFFLVMIFGQCKNGVLRGDADNGGLLLPQDFEAVVVVDSLGGARHIAVNDNGDIYVKLRASYPDGSNSFPFTAFSRTATCIADVFKLWSKAKLRSTPSPNAAV